MTAKKRRAAQARAEAESDTKSADSLRHGQFAVCDGVEYRLGTRGGSWTLLSAKPLPGFTKVRSGEFFRKIAEDEEMECFRITHRGTYRGIDVSISGSNRGRVMAVTKDVRARDDGFEPFERSEWVKLIDREDGDLRVQEVRTSFPMPWRKNSA
ncbi:hypothetical protein ACYX8G_12660 [Microbacterium saperdae]